MLRTQTALFSSWSPRMALFAGALICMAILLHRLLGMPTPLALNLFAVAFALAAVAILLGAVAIVDVWRRGVPGFAWALIGMGIAGCLYLWPLTYLQTYVDLPRINDVSTDVATPPPLIALARWRGRGANAAAYPTARFARLQLGSYPDVRPLLVNRSLEDTYEIALATIKKLHFQVVAEKPPGQRQTGLIEAIDRTMVIGFYDDVVVRVSQSGERSRIDVRSASRYGQHDFGRNVQRIRRVLSEMQARVDASVPASGRAKRVSKADKAKPSVKRRQSRSRRSRERRN